MKIHFCPIDARDNYFCRYNPIGVSDNEEKGRIRLLNSTNTVFMLSAQREYLTELKALQDRIKNKYESLLENDNIGAVEEYHHSLNETEYKKVEQKIIELYPGKEAKYYT